MLSISLGAPADVASSCVLCCKNPRGCGGQISPCMPCAAAYVDQVANDRKARQRPPAGMKICHKCGETKPHEEFSPAPRSFDGRPHRCRQCSRQKPRRATRR